jgi:hypothetical protein
MGYFYKNQRVKMQNYIAACSDRQIAIGRRGVQPIFSQKSADQRLMLP